MGKELKRNLTTAIDAETGSQHLKNESVEIIVTSPPYWGQRTSKGIGVEEDPREYLEVLLEVFKKLLPKVSREGIVWINLGDSYNTPVKLAPGGLQVQHIGVRSKGFGQKKCCLHKKTTEKKTVC